MSDSKTQIHAPKGMKGKKGNSKARKDALTEGGWAGVNTMVYEPWMPVFPARIIKRLRYSTTLALVSSSGAVATHVFRANDLFDPDFTSTGHQPMGFDQLMVWYNHFTVRSAKITCQFKNIIASSPTCMIRVDGDSTPITVIDRLVELGGCVLECLEAKGGYGANKKLSLAVDIAKLQGVSPVALTSDPSLQGSVAASPSECTYFHIAIWDTTAVTGGAEVDVILEQEAYFGEPRNLTQS